MSGHALDIAFWNYDRVRPLTEGSVTIEGVAPRYHTKRIVTEIFEGMCGGAYDVSELGFTYFLRTMDLDDPPFLALPVFPNRAFRHSAIYINTEKGIRRPEDLTGKTVGELALYGHDSGVVPKGILSDDFGFAPRTCRWVVGGIDFPMKPIDFVPRIVPDGVDVRWTEDGTDLGVMLEKGEIDALISADIPRCVLAGSPKVGRLFEDYEAVEREYFRRTGIFPIMHLVAVRRSLVREHPEIVRAVYDAFGQAKEAARKHLLQAMTFNTMETMVPWLTKLAGENRALLGDDWWPYGVTANRPALDAYLRWHHEQGLSKRLMTCEAIFVPELLDT